MDTLIHGAKGVEHTLLGLGRVHGAVMAVRHASLQVHACSLVIPHEPARSQSATLSLGGGGAEQVG